MNISKFANAVIQAGKTMSTKTAKNISGAAKKFQEAVDSKIILASMDGLAASQKAQIKKINISAMNDLGVFKKQDLMEKYGEILKEKHLAQAMTEKANAESQRVAGEITKLNNMLRN